MKIQNKALSPLIAGIILIAFTIAVGILVTSALTSVTKQQTEATTIKQQCPLASLEILSASCKITNITGEAENWWDSSYSYRQQITVTNNAGSVLEKGYTISTEFDLNTCVNQGKCSASGNDTRVVWFNTTSEENIELDRILEPSTALSFDGSDDYVIISADTSLDVPDEMTVSIWVKPNNLGGVQSIIGRNLGGGSQYYFRFDGTTIDAAILDIDYYFLAENVGSFSNGEWYHIVMTYSESNDWYEAYSNGQSIASGTLSSVSYAEITGDLNIGRDNRDVNYFTGIIDEVAIFNRSLNSTEISDLYNNGIGRPIDSTWFNTTGLVGLWHMDINGYDNSTTVYDSSGNGNNGTIYGAYHTDSHIVPIAEADNTIYFATQENISAGGWDANYSLYYGNPTADAPPANGSNVYLFFEPWDVSTGAYTWTESDAFETWEIDPSGYLHAVSTGTLAHKYADDSAQSIGDVFKMKVRIKVFSTNDGSCMFDKRDGVKRVIWGINRNKVGILTSAWNTASFTADDSYHVYTLVNTGAGGTVKLYIDNNDTPILTVNYDDLEANTADRVYVYWHQVGMGGTAGTQEGRVDYITFAKYISPEPSLSLQTQQIQTNMTESYQLTTTIYNPSQIELTNITAIAVIGNNTYTQTTPYSISQGQYLTINTNASAGLIEKIRISALNCPVYIEALDVGRCE